jgi:hypothetical protein
LHTTNKHIMKRFKKLQILFTFALLLSVNLKADEGMWMINLIERLNSADMQKMGLQLTPQEIYSINQSSVKDAIVMINDGHCTGFVVSREGLMMTNHHCVLEYITDNSIKYNADYVNNGFWAVDKRMELYNPNLKVSFLVRVEDITEKIVSKLDKTLTDVEREEKIKELTDKIIADATKGTYYDAVVKEFYKGNEFYLYVYETYRDVRLVGAPPMSIGNFGADSDNWLWPRHTADFAFLRIYMSPEGEPATYNKRRNIPYVPKHHLPISMKGLEKDDFTMVLGYPGTTERFMTSYGVAQQTDHVNPTIVKIRDSKLRIMNEQMMSDPNIELMYRSKYNRSSNYWKYFIGQTETLKRLKVFEKKENLEGIFEKWVNADAKRKEYYGDALPTIKIAYDQLKKYNLAKYYFRESIIRGPEIFGFTRQFDSLYYYMTAPGIENDQRQALIADQSTKLKYYASNYHFNGYDIETDKKLFVALLRMYYDEVPSEFHSDVFKEVESKYKSNFTLYANFIYEKSIFSNKESLYEFLRVPDAKKMERDPAYLATKQLYDAYDKILSGMKVYELMLKRGERTFQKGILEMMTDRKFYPDANSTMRLSYGKVTTYTPTDGNELPYFTTFEEYLRKENPNNSEFQIPQKLKDLYLKKEFSKYADKNGVLRMCVLTDNDVTGGNSGAPLINGKGEVVGIVFDINWEATASSLWYVDGKTRTISSDIKYIMFLVDKYAEAQNIIQELDIRY